MSTLCPFATPTCELSSVLTRLLIAGLLMALCVAIHAVGLTTAIRWTRRRPNLAQQTFWPATSMLVAVAGWTVFLHLLEIGAWAGLYAWRQAMPSLQSAFYFSAVTFTTTGYGDLVLPEEWRLVGGVEALTGIIMCGWSTGFFFAVVSRMYGTRELKDESTTATNPPTP